MLSPRFDAALGLAHRVHRRQRRKGTAVPYLAHLLGVAAIALEYGATEDEAIAALLHDALEDSAEFAEGLTVDEVRDEIRRRFGDAVLEIVEHLTDTTRHPKPSWPERKQAHLAALRRAPGSALLVAAADKLHNVRALIRDYRAAGDALWDRFNPEAGRDAILGYYRSMLELLQARRPGPLVDDLERELSTLERLVTGAR